MAFDVADTLDMDNYLSVALKADATLQSLFGAPGDPTGVRLYSEMAPQEPVYPFGIFSAQDAEDINVVGGFRIGDWACYTVKWCGNLGFSQLRPYNQAADLVLTRGGNVVGQSGQTFIFRWVRQNPVRYPDMFDNKNYYYLGGMYRALLSGL